MTNSMRTPRLHYIALLLLVVPFFYGIPSTYAQNKDVIIVLDESNSMDGDKWESLVYAMQLVAALLDENDAYYIVRQDGNPPVEIALSQKQNSIDKIKKFSQSFNTDHETVIQSAVDQMRSNAGRKKVLLFYGDGDWESPDFSIQNSCSNLVSSYNEVKPELYFLKVEDREDALGTQSAFEKRMRPIKLFDVIETNPNKGNELTSNLQNISKKIAGVNEEEADFDLNGSTLSFKTELPLKKLLLVYQKKSSGNLSPLQVKNISSTDQDLELAMQLDMESQILKGKYLELKEKQQDIIRAGQTIDIELDKNVSKDELFLIPIAAATLNTKLNSPFESHNAANNEYVVCDQIQSVELGAFLTHSQNGSKLPLNGVVIEASSGSNTYSFTNQTDQASAVIPLQQDTTYISISARYKGYLQQTDRILSIIKAPCQAVVDTSTLDLGETPFFEFIRNGYCLGITYTINNKIVHPENYSLKVKGMPLPMRCSIDSTGNAFRVCFEKRSWACDCMIPMGEIRGAFEAVPKSAGVVSTVKNWKFVIKKEGNLFQRCKKCIIWFILLIILAIYLYGIIRKDRFDATAKFEIVETDKTSIYAPENKKPRKKLVTGTISRYLIPFVPESIIIDGFKVIASPTKSTILIAKESLSEKMSKNGEPVNPKSKKDLKVFRNNTIEIERTPTTTVIYTYKVK